MMTWAPALARPSATAAGVPDLAAEAAGLVLFGSYCANDLSDSGLDALSISGSEDALSTPEKSDEAAQLAPADTPIAHGAFQPAP